MSQATDYVLSNQSGAAFRAELNTILAAIVSANSGASEPTTMYAFMPWADTSAGLLKIRNAANDAWVTVGTLADVGLGLLSRAGGAMTGLLTTAKGADVASATTLPLINDGNYFDVTGTTTITAFASLGVGTWIGLHFDGILTLTHSADLVLPTGANITTAAGDESIWVEYASGDWRCVSYTRADGSPLVAINIPGQTEDTAPTPSDLVLEYDTSASALKKVTIANLLFADTKLYRLNADVVGANATGAQSMFGVGVTLEANTVYEFEIVVAFLKTAGATNHTFRLGFGGTATLNNIMYEYVTQNSTSATDTNGSLETGVVETAAETIITPGIATATQYVYGVIKGTVSIGDAGTFIPQYYLGAAPGGAYSTKAGSFVKIRRIGASGANNNIGGWA
jgi:hypothetical protein